jgi:hypothetical protein
MFSAAEVGDNDEIVGGAALQKITPIRAVKNSVKVFIEKGLDIKCARKIYQIPGKMKKRDA